MSTFNRINVFVISRCFLLRQGISVALASLPEAEISGSADPEENYLSAIDALSTNVAIVDVDNSAEAGLAIARKIKQTLPGTGIILIASNWNDTLIFQAIEAQASGLIGKDVSAAELITTVRRVARGEYPIYEHLASRPKAAEQVSRRFDEELYPDDNSFISNLTQREKDILTYIAQGFLNKQIATELGISEQTIKNHITSILRKLNASARTEAVVIGIKQGLISIN